MPLCPLAEAANANDLSTVVALLTTDASSLADRTQALARAAMNLSQRREIAEMLIAHGADVNGDYGGNYGPIVLATCESLAPERLEFLIGHGADVRWPARDSTYGLTSPLIALLSSYVRGRSATKHRCIAALLANGAVVPNGVTSAMMAIHRGDVEQLRYEIRADPDLIQRHYPDMPFGFVVLSGATLLHLAVDVGDIACVDCLISCGASLETTAIITHGLGGQTPLFHAIASGCAEGTAMLTHLVRRYGQHLNPSIAARVVVCGEPIPKAMTALEFAHWTADDTTPAWRRSTAEELALLATLRD